MSVTDLTKHSIRRKRQQSSPKVIAEKYEAGTATGTERALLRISATNTRILIGHENLEEWDDEELMMGQRRDKNGRFQSVKPKLLPRALYDEIVRRTVQDAQEHLRANALATTEALTDIALGLASGDPARVKAIQMVLDRVLGKETQKVEVTQKKRWEIALEQSIISIGEEGAARLKGLGDRSIVEAMAYEVDDEEDDLEDDDENPFQ